MLRGVRRSNIGRLDRVAGYPEFMPRAFRGLIWISFAACAWAQAPVGFDESGADRVRVFTETYELALSKANGAILGITDKIANKPLAIASRNGCLWGSNFQGTPTAYRGGCNFGAGKPDAFAYQWDAGQSVLTLSYNSASTSNARVDVTVTMTFQPGWFDLKLSLANHMGATLQTLLFPSDMVLTDSSVDAAYMPYYLPGARLKTGFFTANRSISVVYPSARAFADYLALDYSGGRVAWYAINPGGKIAPVVLGFQDDDKTKAGTFYAFHTFQTWTGDGANFATPVMRFQVGQSPEKSIATYRVENGIADYPALADKLGDLAQTMAAAPMVKMDFRSIGRTFADLSTRLDQIRAPAILHPVSYWPPAFDRNYPDFLPPDARFGSTADFRAFVDAAHARGLLVMPYTNPTWWDDQSPTAKSVPDLAVFAVLGMDGKPVYESYGVNHGFVSSPHSPPVQNRLAALMAQWRDDVGVDLVLQDQIGSRSWLRDFNPAAPDPQSYSDRWLQFTRDYAAQNLMTEDGWDRIAATEVGFSGSLLTGATTWDPAQARWGPGSRGNKAFGVGLWEPYPLGVWLFHDKVLFYHHDLDTRPMNAGVEVLTWNAAFGVMAGYYWPELRSAAPDWAATAAAFQPAILARTAGRMLSGYRALADQVTESRFDDLAVVANWNAQAGYDVDGYTIAPSGFLARADDGSVAGGVFVNSFGGAPLSAGVHYLLVERGDGVVSVRHPSGPDTSVTVSLPAEWDLSAGVQVQAMAGHGSAIGPVAVTLDGYRATFFCARMVANTAMEHYEITAGSN